LELNDPWGTSGGLFDGARAYDLTGGEGELLEIRAPRSGPVETVRHDLNGDQAPWWRDVVGEGPLGNEIDALALSPTPLGFGLAWFRPMTQAITYADLIPIDDGIDVRDGRIVTTLADTDNVSSLQLAEGSPGMALGFTVLQDTGETGGEVVLQRHLGGDGALDESCRFSALPRKGLAIADTPRGVVGVWLTDQVDAGTTSMDLGLCLRGGTASRWIDLTGDVVPEGVEPRPAIDGVWVASRAMLALVWTGDPDPGVDGGLHNLYFTPITFATPIEDADGP